LMKGGASDFVMKDKLSRLAPVIERELKDADVRRERRQAQDALRANEKLLMGITSSLGEGILVLNNEGKLLFMNPEAERLLGDDSALVRGAAVWALSQLLPADEFAALRSRVAGKEQDAAVRAEWDESANA